MPAECHDAVYATNCAVARSIEVAVVDDRGGIL
jgi:hypothetical protein